MDNNPKSPDNFWNNKKPTEVEPVVDIFEPKKTVDIKTEETENTGTEEPKNQETKEPDGGEIGVPINGAENKNTTSPPPVTEAVNIIKPSIEPEIKPEPPKTEELKDERTKKPENLGTEEPKQPEKAPKTPEDIKKSCKEFLELVETEAKLDPAITTELEKNTEEFSKDNFDNRLDIVTALLRKKPRPKSPSKLPIILIGSGLLGEALGKFLGEEKLESTANSLKGNEKLLEKIL